MYKILTISPFRRRGANRYTTQMENIPVGRSLYREALHRFVQNRAALWSSFLLLLVMFFAAGGQLLSSYNIDDIDWDMLGQVGEKGGPSWSTGHYFGFDDSARDLYSRVVQGSQVSLLVGIVGAFVAIIIGTIYGAVAGYIGGKTDAVMMRLVDVLMSIPYMFVLVILVSVAKNSMFMIFVGIGMTAWLEMSRIVRGQTLTIKNCEYIEAATVIGVPPWQIIWRHIVPNLLGVVVVYASLLVPQMILIESFISFLGLGVQEPFTSWGALIHEGTRSMYYGKYWQLAFPLLFFVVTIFCFFYIGDGVRDALNPKDR